MQKVDEQVKVEEFQIKQFERLGLSNYEATKAVDEGIDWHEVERLKSLGCYTTLAIKIAR